MNDRELLDDAAIAAGYVGWTPEWWAMCDGENHWDPLRHNGQALRLAVKLRIDVVQFSTIVRASAPDAEDCHEDQGDDPCAATRRAIVRAAAAIRAASRTGDAAT